MRVIKGVAINDTTLLASSVPETPPAAYAGGTTYALDATCSTGIVGGVITVWRSLQAGNIGHDPASSPTWWQAIGDTYAVYAAGTNYALDDIVIDPVAHKAYTSQAAGNLGNALSDTTKWLDSGQTNRYAMFDAYRNTRTVSPVPIVVTLKPGQRCNSLALSGVLADTAVITVVSRGETVYPLTKTLRTRETFGWYDYFFGSFTRKVTMVTWDMPPYTDAEITITLSAATGNVECGLCAIDTFVHVGKVEYNPRVSGLNYSEVERDQWNNAKMTPARNIPAVELRVDIERIRVNRLRELMDEINSVPVVIAGLDDDTHGYFDALFIVGFVRRYEFDLAHPNDAYLNLSLEEI